MRLLGRTSLALFGANVGALVVAALEWRRVLPDLEGARAGESTEVLLANAGVLAPIAWIFGLIVLVVGVLLEPAGSRSPAEHFAWLRALPFFPRARLAAVLPLAAIATTFATVAVAHLAKTALADGAPRAQGAALALTALGVYAAFGTTALALSSPVRRILARGGGRFPVLLDPGATLGVGLAIAAAPIAFGIAVGDTGGDGPSAFSIFGVLKRGELDLSPVSHALVIAGGAYVGLVLHAWLAKKNASTIPAIVALVLAFVPLGATARAATAMNAHLAATRALDKHAPIAHAGATLLRRMSDRDKDGRSKYFGGLDCDDRDPTRSPDKLDVPGNGIDEDCSGADTPLPKAPAKIEEPTRSPESSHPAYNVVLITIDTLRADVGFLGYKRPVTPNLDALAEKSTVFEHAYSMASYTGKSIGPMLIGKYPSETERDGSHFNKYGPENVFVTTRLRAAGVHTFGAAGHWYWKPWSGVTQGMDYFDLSPIPQGMTDNDTTVSGDAVSYAAVRLLGDEKNVGTPDGGPPMLGDAGIATSGRFFMWIHYFDPHAQYVTHYGAPDMRGEDRGPAAETRAAYDNEVWFTDQQIGKVLEKIAASPFADKTAIIVTADHGEAFGEHNMSWHGAELYEMLVHVPLLIYVPGAEGHRVSAKRSHIDLAPTILDLEGVKRPDDPSALDGASLVPDILGKAPFEERDVYMDMPAGPWNQTRRALITGPAPGMKIIHMGGPQYVVYDLAQDPLEKKDLSSDKDVLQPLVDKLAEKRATLKEIEVKPDSP